VAVRAVEVNVSRGEKKKTRKNIYQGLETHLRLEPPFVDCCPLSLELKLVVVVVDVFGGGRTRRGAY
jgi:hypothetical protein